MITDFKSCINQHRRIQVLFLKFFRPSQFRSSQACAYQSASRQNECSLPALPAPVPVYWQLYNISFSCSSSTLVPSITEGWSSTNKISIIVFPGPFHQVSCLCITTNTGLLRRYGYYQTADPPLSLESNWILPFMPLTRSLMPQIPMLLNGSDFWLKSMPTPLLSSVTSDLHIRLG